MSRLPELPPTRRWTGDFNYDDPFLRDLTWAERGEQHRRARMCDIDVDGLDAQGIIKRYRALGWEVPENEAANFVGYVSTAKLPRSQNEFREQPTDVQAVLDELSSLYWVAVMFKKRCPKGGDAWHNFYGREIALSVALQRFGVLPVGAFNAAQSTEELCGKLAVLREVLPRGFERLSSTAAAEIFRSHGIEVTVDGVPKLQRHLVAGLRKHKDVPPSALANADEETAPVTRELDESAGPHAQSVGGAQ